MTFPWREQPAALLEQHCNPRVAAPSFQEALDRYAARSAAARQRLPGVYDSHGVLSQRLRISSLSKDGEKGAT